MNKGSEGVEISAELFKNLKDDTVKVLHSVGQQILKSQQWPQVSDFRKSGFIPIPKKDSAKELPQNYTHFIC